jgi:hypothetical protein
MAAFPGEQRPRIARQLREGGFMALSSGPTDEAGDWRYVANEIEIEPFV